MSYPNELIFISNTIAGASKQTYYKGFACELDSASSDKINVDVLSHEVVPFTALCKYL